MLGHAVRFQKIGRNHRRDHPRNGQTEQHRDDHRQAETLEKLAGNSAHHANRQEHRDNRQGCCHHRQADFIRRVDRCLIGAFAHAHMADDILDLDNGIIDQHSCDQAQRQQ